MKAWKRYGMIEKKKRRILSRVVRRRILLKWNHFVFLERKNEIIFRKIILNRWRIFADDRIERRSIAFRAMRHWARYLCGVVLRSWNAVATKERGRLRSPVSRYRHCLKTLPQVQYTTRSRQTSRTIAPINSESRVTSCCELSPTQRRITLDKTTTGGFVARPERNRYAMQMQSYYSRKTFKATPGKFAAINRENRVRSCYEPIRTRAHSQQASYFDHEASKAGQRAEKIVNALTTPQSARLPTWVTRALSEKGNSKSHYSLKNNCIRNSSNIDIDGFRAEGKYSDVKPRLYEADIKMRSALKPAFYNDAK